MRTAPMVFAEYGFVWRVWKFCAQLPGGTILYSRSYQHRLDAEAEARRFRWWG